MNKLIRWVKLKKCKDCRRVTHHSNDGTCQICGRQN